MDTHKMRIVLVNINQRKFRSRVAPLGLCSIATYLRSNINKELDIKILDQNVEENIYKRIKEEQFDLIGVSSVTQNFEEAKNFIRFSKRQVKVPIILGGVHVSTLPSSLPKHADIGIVGEGEDTILEIVRTFINNNEFNRLSDIKGICYHKNGDLIINERRPLIEPLDKIPIPDRKFLNMEYYLKKSSIVPFQTARNAHIMTSRGCSYSCTFCSTSSFWGKPRTFSVERVIEEIKDLIDNYNVELIHIFDDLFLINRKRFFEITDRIEKEQINQKVKFMCLVRTDLLNEEVMEALKRMNVVCVGVGLESGSKKILSYLKNKTTTIEQSRRAIKYCKDYKITCMGSFMIGNPNETKEDIQQTLKMIKDNNHNPYFSALTYITTPLPGTQLWEYAKQIESVSDDMNWNDLCMDIPMRKDDFKNIPYLPDILFDDFYEIAQKLREENNIQHLKQGTIILTEDFLMYIIFHPSKSFFSLLKLLKMRWEIMRES